MGVYKVPQDVEADDKLLGPFTFRQFIYLLILAALIALAFALGRIFIALAFIPLPPIALFAVLALPIKKDQPMETYLVAILSYYFKPRVRFWMPGQKETAIEITAPKIIERPRTRDITSKEASHRISFLTGLIDTGGRSIHDGAASSLNQQILNEASQAFDMMDNYSSMQVTRMLDSKEHQQRQAIIEKMRQTISEKNPEDSPSVISKTIITSGTKNPPSTSQTTQNPENGKQNPLSISQASTNNIISTNTTTPKSVPPEPQKTPTTPESSNNILTSQEGETFVSLH